MGVLARQTLLGSHKLKIYATRNKNAHARYVASNQYEKMCSRSSSRNA